VKFHCDELMAAGQVYAREQHVPPPPGLSGAGN